MLITQSERLTIRALEEKDAALLSRWLSNPVVLEFYEGRDQPHDLELVWEHFYKDRDGITSGIVLFNDREIGYVQSYEISTEERREYGYYNDEEAIFGMDQFIGEPECWNQGLGTEMIRAMVLFLIQEKQADRIVMDPQACNVRALHVYEKSGFRKIKLLPNHEWHEGKYRDCWLMEYSGEEKINY